MNTTGKRKLHLSFCSTCKNRNFTFEKGIICNITNQVAKFEKNCTSFVDDREERKRIKVKLDEKISTDYPDNNFLIDLVSDKYYSHINKNVLDNSKFYNINQTRNLIINHNVAAYKGLMLFFIVLLSVTLFYQYDDLINNPYNFQKTGIFYIFIGAIITTYYFGFYHKFKPVLITDNEGVLYKNDKIYWRQIITSKLITEHQGKSTIYKILIGTSSSVIIELNLDSAKIKPSDFWKIIHLNTT